MYSKGWYGVSVCIAVLISIVCAVANAKTEERCIAYSNTAFAADFRSSITVFNLDTGQSRRYFNKSYYYDFEIRGDYIYYSSSSIIAVYRMSTRTRTVIGKDGGGAYYRKATFLDDDNVLYVKEDLSHGCSMFWDQAIYRYNMASGKSYCVAGCLPECQSRDERERLRHLARFSGRICSSMNCVLDLIDLRVSESRRIGDNLCEGHALHGNLLYYCIKSDPDELLRIGTYNIETGVTEIILLDNPKPTARLYSVDVSSEASMLFAFINDSFELVHYYYDSQRNAMRILPISDDAIDLIRFAPCF